METEQQKDIWTDEILDVLQAEHEAKESSMPRYNELESVTIKLPTFKTDWTSEEKAALEEAVKSAICNLKDLNYPAVPTIMTQQENDILNHVVEALDECPT